MHALIALLILEGNADPREGVAVVSLIHAAALKIGVKPKDVFDRVEKQIGLSGAPTLDAFLQRSDEDKSIEAMGYVEGSDEDGFRFVRTW